MSLAGLPLASSSTPAQTTFFGQLADKIAGRRVPTAFDRGVSCFTWLMIRFIVVMVPTVFLINGITKHDWLEALLFAVAVAVGLTPEMLPMIVTVNLAKGAVVMSRAKVIVKRLNSIQNFGAMDTLCTDKTGTLTQDRIILKRHLDINGQETDRVLQCAYLNSHFQSGLKNLLDVAVLQHVDVHKMLGIEEYAKVDEIPFDFVRRRLSVVVARPDDKHILICKGAVEEIFAVCRRYEIDDATGALDASHFEAARRETISPEFRWLSRCCYSLQGVCHAAGSVHSRRRKEFNAARLYSVPRSAQRQCWSGHQGTVEKGVRVKILTGDNEVITRKYVGTSD